jgi:hypothetical protein
MYIKSNNLGGYNLTVKYKIKNGFLLSMLFLLFQGCTQKKEQCRDFLAPFKIKNLTFLECKEGKYFQLNSLNASYKVMGKNAKEVEAELVEKINMSPLKYSCCVWEGGLADTTINNNNLIVEMVSEETYIDHRNEWDNIDFFYVTVFLLLEDP